jgi:hypothetical protein
MRGWGLRGLDLGTQLPALIDQEAIDLRYVETVNGVLTQS